LKNIGKKTQVYRVCVETRSWRAIIQLSLGLDAVRSHRSNVFAVLIFAKLVLSGVKATMPPNNGIDLDNHEVVLKKAAILVARIFLPVIDCSKLFKPETIAPSISLYKAVTAQFPTALPSAPPPSKNHLKYSPSQFGNIHETALCFFYSTLFLHSRRKF
jgi:hypothetical protein